MELRMDATKAALTLRADGRRIGALARGGDLDAAVPTCPGWDLGALVGHLGAVFTSRAQLVREGGAERPVDPEPPARDALLDWYDAALEDLVTTLRTTDPARPVWTWNAAWHDAHDRRGTGTAAFWARRMAHEAVVHRADAELATGAHPARVDAVVAVDGIDDALDTLLGVRNGGPLPGSGRTVLVQTPDERWRVSLGAERPTAERGAAGDTDALLAGTPSHVLYALYGRLPLDEVDVRGDADAVDELLAALRHATG